MAGQFDHLKKKNKIELTPDSFINEAAGGAVATLDRENVDTSVAQEKAVDSPEEAKKKGRPRKDMASELLITTKGRHTRKKSEAFNLYLPKELDKEIAEKTAGNKQLVLNYLVKTAWDSIKRKGKMIVVDADEVA
ncbi:hypothetical protein Psal006b_03371 (plasmid) [Piscirickettsia salmonis]|uniref:Carbohydrate binding module (Family 6) n=1 Tax=Piscirickettsia salmonis TaxID=1238 RepID=A0A1L6THU6_PISSA|nr:hypothetical protein [Piscirickettsia salmonis]AKP74869.1 hypothetical protein PSLF89_1p21 [Piscirickettsia salmonis LF-89 = ATCC VR-1361]ALB24530.1 carbohydrate binding module (family 6) [Piscirickettsia salmonis]ALY04432.1 hypothetical protein AWE47_16025 [Piscirickettsia salmonis]AOS37052.1 hypothetical protein AVM72_16995 [Piscirickettsia salmonis]APS62177.1 hypothetical protein AVI53_16630 [Piscirickettsia salmonis]